MRSVYNFSAQWLPSFGNQRNLNFGVWAVRGLKLRSRYLAILGVLGIRKSALCEWLLVRFRYQRTKKPK